MSVPPAIITALAAGPDLLLAKPGSLAEASRQFEALLIQELLKSARGDGPGWFGAAEDAAGSTAADLALEQFAQALARSGGLGLSARIEGSLSGSAQPAARSETPALRGVLGSRP